MVVVVVRPAGLLRVVVFALFVAGLALVVAAVLPRRAVGVLFAAGARVTAGLAFTASRAAAVRSRDALSAALAT